MKKSLKPIRLKWKVFGYLLVFCVLLLGILWLFETVLLYDMYKFIRKKEMNSAILQVEKNIDSDSLQEIFDILNQEKEIMVNEANEMKPAAKVRPEGFKKPRQESLTRTKDFVKADGTVMTLTFHAIITPVDATVATLRIQLTVITAIMMILAVLLAFLIARHVSKPIEEINKSAKELAKGKYDTEFSATGFLEIEELSGTLNLTAGELSKVEGFRRELLTNIAHDLRTPLSLIYSYAEMMQDFPDEIMPEQTQVIMDEVSRLSSLVNDVFEISRLETGEQTQNLERYCLTDQLKEIIGRVEELVRRDGYLFYFNSDAESESGVWINADQVKIAQVFYNLLLNAINYAGDGKSITVRQSTEGNYVKVEVIDQGTGITKEYLPYIWNRYYKVDKNHKRAVTGTGLGLSIVKKIIEAHHGTYGVESEPGSGSDFWFRIPKLKA